MNANNTINQMNYSLLKKTIKDSRVSFREFATFVNMTEAGLRRSIDNNTLTVDVFEKICQLLNMYPAVFFEHQNAISITGQQVHTGIGDNKMNTIEDKNKEIEHLRLLLKEKERTIKILMKNNNL